YPWREWFLTFEGAGETKESETAYYAVPELVWKPRRHLELLVAVPVGLTAAAADYGVIAGITVEIERLTGRGEDGDLGSIPPPSPGSAPAGASRGGARGGWPSPGRVAEVAPPGDLPGEPGRARPSASSPQTASHFWGRRSG